jgi:hypothetical protein
MENNVAADLPDWVPPGVDTQRANTARVYDYWLGGTHNFLADQDVARAIATIEPNMREEVRANRAFLGRAVRFMAGSGIRQFLDIGSGIPTEGNVHEIAQRAAPGSRVVYVDVDPVAVAHSRVILTGNEHAAIVEADLREPDKILVHPGVQSLIDFSRPVGLLVSAVLHFLSDEDDPWQIMATLRAAMAPGSYLLVCHVTDADNPAVANAATKVYNRSVPSGIHFRSRAEIGQFFDGFELLEPGLVYMPQWRPDSPGDVPADLSNFWGLVGVGLKP